MCTKLRKDRDGFTLVELLVVMAIIAILAFIVIAFLPSITANSADAEGARSLQGWLGLARQKAIRNQNPYGLRLWVKDVTTMLVTECQYLEQPDDFTGGMVYTQNNLVANDTIVMTNVDPTGGFMDPTGQLYSVQPGDYFELLGTGLMHRIFQVNPGPIQPPGNSPKPPPIPGPSLSLVYAPDLIMPPPWQPRQGSGLPYQITNPTTGYRILRQPRVVGTETMGLPSGVVVDLTTNQIFGNPLPFVPTVAPLTGLPTGGGYVDVVFSPSGALGTPNVTTATLNFWVRMPDQNTPGNVFLGTPTVIAVFGATGFVGAYPPVSSGPNPYVDIR